MPSNRRWFGWFLRFDILVSVLIVAIPFIVLMVLGILWLVQNDWLLPWLAGLGTVVVLLWVRRIILVRARRKNKGSERLPSGSVEENPEWTGHERRAYRAACDDIDKKTKEPVPWPEMQDRAMEVVRSVAGEISGGKTDALGFTVPEALLLMERAAGRYRRFLRSDFPLSDRLSVGRLYWIWKHRQEINSGLEISDKVRRVFRMIANPPLGIAREIEAMITEGSWTYVSGQFQAELQRELLKEFAKTAVDLYSGRLKYSDAELLQEKLSTTLVDLKRVSSLDPVRILVVGQTSAGKSSVIDALTDGFAPEIDPPPTTQGLTTYEVAIDDVRCHLIDTPGFDTTMKTQKRVLSELTQCDLAIWILCANRPARKPDHELLERFNQWFTSRPRRRKPLVLTVATGVDLLPFSSPWPSDNRNLEDHECKIEEAMIAIADDVGEGKPKPVRAKKPVWNIEKVIAGIESRLPDAIQTQLNRRRLEKESFRGDVLDQLRRTKNGMGQLARVLGSRFLKRSTSIPDKPTDR
ncbi:MAG: GTPase domain-containing protein [Paracoccaceae bacterium]|nr:GTPase domain-containing protein [Paracoccaceae bacterium]